MHMHFLAWTLEKKISMATIRGSKRMEKVKKAKHKQSTHTLLLIRSVPGSTIRTTGQTKQADKLKKNHRK
jgi:hypothetical protein